MFRTAVILLITLFTILHSTNAGCRVNLKTDLKYENAPLFLKRSGNSFELLHPRRSDSFEWMNGDKVIVGCSPETNSLTNIRTNTGAEMSTAELTCVEGLRFSVEELNYQQLELRNIKCKSRVGGSTMPLNERCADGTGHLYALGFKMRNTPFVNYFTVCYNLDKASAIYTVHQLPGMNVEYKQVGQKRPLFDDDIVKSKVNVKTIYTQLNQFNRFTALLGGEELARNYIYSNSFLARGHLTPDADAVLNTWSSATYFFINVVPQWHYQINVGNWVRTENSVREAAARLKENITVHTGVHDVLHLPNIRGNSVPITLDDGGLVEVPKLLWKVVVHDRILPNRLLSSRGIAFITLNNPSATKKGYLCRDICEQYNWYKTEYKELRKGFTYCCTVQEAQIAIQEIPRTIFVGQVLAKPQAT